MRKNLILLLLLLALAAVAFWLWRKDTGTTIAGALTDFAVADTASIDRIFIADKQGQQVDLRREKAGWSVNGLPANPIPINTLLKTFIRVEVKTPVSKSMEAHVLKTMASKAVKVEIYTGDDDPEKIWYVGHGTQDQFGVFAVLEKPGTGRSDSPFVLGMTGFTGVINTRFHARLDEWRSTNVAVYHDLSQLKSIHVEHPASDSAAYTVTYAGENAMGLLDAQGRSLPMDSLLVRDMLSHYRDAHFEFLERQISKVDRDSTLATKPCHVVTITTEEEGTRRIPFWWKKPYPGERNMELELITEDHDRMYAMLDDTALVVVQRYWFDRMVPYLGQLTGRTPIPPPPTAPPPDPSRKG